MGSRNLTFKGASGARLAARLDLPADGHPRAYALFAHCFTCSKDLKAVAHVSRALCREGIGVLRFDFTGLGESAGDFAHTTFSSNIDDLSAAAEFMDQEIQAPQLLLGHSLGGAAVLQAAHGVASCRAVVTIGAPADPRHVKRHLSSSLEEIRERGAAEIVIAGRPFTIRKEFLDDLEAQNMAKAIRELGRPLLIMHAPTDEIVGVDNAAQIYTAARHPKSFISLDGANHLLTRREDSEFVAAMIATWATRYLERPERPVRDAEHPNSQVLARLDRARYRTDIVANGHALTADEPASVGGTNAGPSPYDLLLAALGACTTITLRMYADRKGWPLKEVAVHLTHRQLHGMDGAECDSRSAQLDLIERGVRLVGPLDDEQKERLLGIAERCPVHRSLQSGVRTQSRLLQDPPS